jgi:hypothetical protein
MPPNWAGANTKEGELVKWLSTFYGDGAIAKLPEEVQVEKTSFDTFKNLQAWLAYAEEQAGV